jgi:DDE superfamily endonuclease
MAMVPYRGVRYHRKEWAKGDQRLGNAQELFNLRHATLRNYIERAFGILKRKFRILKIGNEYAIQVQIGMVYGLVALYS